MKRTKVVNDHLLEITSMAAYYRTILDGQLAAWEELPYGTDESIAYQRRIKKLQRLIADLYAFNSDLQSTFPTDGSD